MVETPKRSVKDAIATVRDGRPSSLMEAVQVLTDAPPEATEAIAQAARDDNPLVRWVAVSSADARTHDQILTGALEDPDLRIRVAAAVRLASQGRTEGIPTLLDALTSNQVAFGHPPELLADVANQALETLAGESVAARHDAPEARAARWRRWAERPSE